MLVCIACVVREGDNVLRVALAQPTFFDISKFSLKKIEKTFFYFFDHHSIIFIVDFTESIIKSVQGKRKRKVRLNLSIAD